MRKIFLTFIVLTFTHIVFAQNKQTIVVRPETAREKEKRKMNDVVETFQMLGEIGKLEKESKAITLNEVKNSKYSLFVEKKLAEWKKKGDFEKTADWQKRLNDSTAIKKSEIYESSVNEYAEDLDVLRHFDWFYDKYSGQYDSDKEVLVVNTFWGKIPIPVPLDKAKNWHNIQNVGALEAHFFIQNDQLALLSLSTYDEEYTWENPSQAAQIVRNKRLEKIFELERLDSLELLTFNNRLDSVYLDYNQQLLQNPYNLKQRILKNYNKITATGTDNRQNSFNRQVFDMKSEFNSLKNNFESDRLNEYRQNGKLFANETEFDNFYTSGKDIYLAEVKKKTILKYFSDNAKFIESMDFQKVAKENTDSAKFLGVTYYSEIKAAKRKILSAISESQNKPYCSQLLDFVIETNNGLNKEWSKNGQFFENKAEFYNAYLSDDYKKILKTNKKTLKANKKK